MKFTTPVIISQKEPGIDHNSMIFLAGSCFVENIGDKFDYYKLPNKRNPFGILYHPFAIENLISRSVSEREFTEVDIFFHNERWHCFEAHSSLSDQDKGLFLARLNDELRNTREYIKAATHIIITPGTSWVYRQAINDTPVANCHKLPQVNFKKEISDLTEIEESLNSMVEHIRQLNSSTQIIFTISPVRHTKDGLVENQLSKSLLNVAVHNTVKKQSKTSYFPSYEILMDELRDYRFYAEDMLHPGKTGVDYIWEKFMYSWFSPENQKILKEIDIIQKGLAHRAFNEGSTAHQNFLKNLEKKISLIKSRFPQIDF